MTSVPRFPLAEGLSVSRVVVGMGPIADLERPHLSSVPPEFDIDEAALAMSPYVDAGFTTFEAAGPDSSAEDIAGIFGERAERLTLWAPKPGPISKDDVREGVSRSLRRLRAEAIDLVQLQAGSYADPAWLDALFHLQDLRREGLVRHLGLVDFDAAHLRIAVQSGIEIVSNQVSFSLLDMRAAGALSDFCLAHSVHILARGTLVGGFLSEAWLGHEEPDWTGLSRSQVRHGRVIRAAGGWDTFQQLLQRLDEIAMKHGAPIAAVALRAILDQPAVAAIVLGARLTRSEHRDDTLRAFDIELDSEDREKLSKARKHLKKLPASLMTAGYPGPRSDSAPPPYTVRPGPKGRTLVLSGTMPDALAAPLAHRLDDRIWVSGTLASHDGRIVGGNDPAAQFHFIIDKIEGALISLGASLDDVVRTRVFVRHACDGEDIARAHRERFHHVMPAHTLVQADLIGDAFLVEVEAEAVVSS